MLVYFALSGLGGSMYNQGSLVRNARIKGPRNDSGATHLTTHIFAFVATLSDAIFVSLHVFSSWLRLPSRV